MTMPLFETPRLICRRLQQGDVDALLAVYGDGEAMRWVGDGKPLTHEQCAEWIEVTTRNYAARGYGMSALELRRTGAVIGFCGLVHPGGQTEPEVKYALLSAYWGQGLATEAVRALIAYAFEIFHLTYLQATVYPENKASQRVLTKAGLRPEETRHNEDSSTTHIFAWYASEEQ